MARRPGARQSPSGNQVGQILRMSHSGRLARKKPKPDPAHPEDSPYLKFANGAWVAQVPCSMPNKAILAGGSGFLGQALAGRLTARGWDVVVLSRSPRADAKFREQGWNGRTPGAWVGELEGATALINFAGRSINCVHTPENQREILASRIGAVRALGEACAAVSVPPKVWVQVSAVGFYGETGDAWCDEARPAGVGFLAEVCAQWEQAFAELALPRTRRVVLRLGVVLDAHRGALPPLVRLARSFLGGAAGSGRQYLSWIHRDDLLAGFAGALNQPEMTGTFNLCSPAPVTNAGFMRVLRAAVHRPWCPPAPSFIVRWAARHLMHTDPVLVLEGQRANAARVQQAGLKFEHPDLREALDDLLDGPQRPRKSP